LLEKLLSKEVDDISTQPESMKELQKALENKEQEIRALKKKDKEIEREIMRLSASGNVSELKKLLRDPTVNVNSVDEYGATALHYACKNGQDRIMTLLLAHPGIVVNQKNPAGMTPFMMACLHGRSLCAYIMLKDSRVNVNEPDDEGFSPLRRASSHGHLEVLKWWIASNRSQPGNDFADILQSATKNNKTEAVVLLERFRSDPTKTRNEVRNELGIAGQFPVLFLLLILLEKQKENLRCIMRERRSLSQHPLVFST